MILMADPAAEVVVTLVTLERAFGLIVLTENLHQL